MILRADKKLEALNSNQDQAQSQVSEQNVQLALELEQERNQLAAMRGRLDLQQKALDEIQANLQSVLGTMASTSGGTSVILPANQEELYAFIGAKKAEGDEKMRKAGIVEFLARYPSDSRSEQLLADDILSRWRISRNGDVGGAIHSAVSEWRQPKTDDLSHGRCRACDEELRTR